MTVLRHYTRLYYHTCIFSVITAMTIVMTITSCRPAAAQVPDYQRWQHMRTVEPQGYVCYRTLDSIEIDGKIDEESWKKAPWTNYFADIEGTLQPVPRFRTRAKMLWDDYYFYFAVNLEEPHVWGTLVFRDQIVCNENDIEVFIDPDGDNQEYYELEMSPLNVAWDLFLRKAYRDGGPAVQTWEIRGLKSAVHVDGTINDPRDADRGWSIEIAIPWDVLAEYSHRPSPPHHGDQWRVNFSRVEWPFEIVTAEITPQEITGNAYKKTSREGPIACDNWSWSDQGVCNMHCPEMYGYVQFSTAPMGTDTFRPDPTLPARRVLLDIYYAQQDFRKDHERWAQNLNELGIDFGWQKEVRKAPVLETIADGYRASVGITMPDGSSKTVRIYQDSKIEVK